MEGELMGRERWMEGGRELKGERWRERWRDGERGLEREKGMEGEGESVR